MLAEYTGTGITIGGVRIVISHIIMKTVKDHNTIVMIFIKLEIVILFPGIFDFNFIV